MNDLRLHKGVVPRHEKFKEARRVAQATRQRAARSGLLQSLRNFLTSDSFMYGPLLESPPPTGQRRDDSEPHTPEREHEDGDFDGGSTRDDANGTERGESPKEHDNGPEETPIKFQESRTTRTTLSVTRGTPRSGRTVVPPADGNRTLKSTVPVSMSTTTTFLKMQVRGSEGSLLFDDGDQGTSSMTSSYDDDFTLLDSEIAHKVVHMLLSKVGGRYSKELGVNVDAGEEEVEKWFLAVALFHRHLTFDVLKKTFQKLIGAGIVSVRGMLHMEEEDIADILETAGYTTYKHRAASRVRRLALQLEAEHKGKVSTLKHIQDSHEVCRHISNLHGLSTHTCNIFLRELRGVWPGAATDYDRRTNRAAMHLRIAEFDKSEESNKSSILNPHTSLKHLAERTGVDERDLEVALVKLGLAHERHYRECPGGPHCTFLISSDEQANPEGRDRKSVV